MKRLIYSLIAVLALTSCVSMHTGITASSASLSKNNFTYIAKNVQGSASVTQYIALIPGIKDALVNDAKQEILKKFPLKDNQVLSNITIDFKSKLILGPVIRTTKCTVTADIVEFIE
jgi:hypothetical protein